MGPLPAIQAVDQREGAALPDLVGAGSDSAYSFGQYLVRSVVGEGSAAPPGVRPAIIGAPDKRPPSDAVLGAVCDAGVDLVRLAETAEGAGLRDLAGHLRALMSRRAFRRTFMRADHEPQGRQPGSNLPKGVVDQLLDADLARPTSRTPSFVARLKLVPKRGSDAHLWRVILATCDFNKASHEPPPTPLPNLRELIDRVLRNRYAITADLRSYFFQFPVCRGVAADVFAFSVRGRTYAFVRLPMGWRWSPYIATTVAQLLFRLGAPSNMYTTVWIDDAIAVADTTSELREARASIQRQLDEHGVVVKQWSDVSASFEYVGILFDLMSSRIRLSDAFVQSFQEVVARAAGPQPTLREVWTAAGGAIWASYVMRWPYAALASVLATVDGFARDGRHHLDSVVELPAADEATLVAIAAHVGTRPWWSPVVRAKAGPLVACDGSIFGLGVVVHGGAECAFPNGAVEAVWQQRAEARAMCLGVGEALAVAPEGATVTLLTDNLGLAWRMSRWAAPPGLADCVLWVWAAVAAARANLRVGWVPGDVMDTVADPHSRSSVRYRKLTKRDLRWMLEVAFFPPCAGAVTPVTLPFV